MRIKRNDHIGETFGNVTIKSFAYKEGRIYYCNCVCNLCGREFVTRKSGLLNGHTTSCGCVLKKWMESGEANKKHGLSKDRCYWVWTKVKSRCYNPNSREYKNYGGRGIKMCDEWLDPKNFIEWAYAHGYDKDAPKGQCTLDRIDVDGDYEPSNCRFITNERQQNNRRDCHFIEYKGDNHTIADWARILNIPYPSLNGGLKRHSFSMESFLSDYTPHPKRRRS